jgi:hypothetical protein
MVMVHAWLICLVQASVINAVVLRVSGESVDKATQMSPSPELTKTRIKKN